MKTDGSLWFWGNNDNYQGGDETRTARNVPTRIGTANDWQRVVSAGTYCMALKTDQTLYLWGRFGNLAGYFDVPTRTGSALWSSIATSGNHALGVRQDGSLWAWGSNQRGEVGNFMYSGVNIAEPMQRIGSDNDWKSVSAANECSLAVKTNGTLWSWGWNNLGQLGSDPFSGRNYPQQAGSYDGWSTLGAGGANVTHSILLALDGTLWGCGRNDSGQLGFAARDPISSIQIYPATASQSVSVASVSAAIGEATAVTATATSGLPVSFGVTGPATISGNQLTVTAPGPVVLYAYQIGDSVWTASAPVRASVAVTAAKFPQSISFTAIPDKLPGDADFPLTASSSSGLPVTFSVLNGPATLAGNIVHITGAGSVSIRATQAGDSTFAAAPPVDRSFNIVSPQAAFDNWATEAGLTGPDAAFEAEPFHDGVSNLLKYAFNMNTAGPDNNVLAATGNSGLPKIETDSSGSEPILKVQFVRRKNSGLVYSPQWSTTLGDFQPLPGTPIVTSINDQWERVEIQQPASTAPSASAFARIRVSLP